MKRGETGCRRFSRLLVSFSICVLLFSCGKDRHAEPSVDFADYVSAYTGGVIRSDATIQLMFAQDMEVVEVGKPLDEEMFAFTPSLKGKAYWRSNNLMEFVPEEGALKPGKRYQCRFNLSRLMRVDKKRKHFDFSFRVQQRGFLMRLQPMEVTAAAPDKVRICGELLFNEPVKSKTVAKMLSVKDGKWPVRITPEGKADRFSFTIDSIAKTDKFQEVVFIADGKKAQVDDKQRLQVRIPPRNRFCYLSSEPISEPENGIRLVFSEPISSEQDLHGLVELQGYSSFVVQATDNKLDLFFENPSAADTLTVRIAGSLESETGHRLGKTSVLKLKVRPLSPQLALIDEGVVLPDAKDIRLNFKAVSLQAVDVEVVRIYQENLLGFLQQNRLDGNEGIRQAGRMVCRKKLLLNPNPATANAWHNYSLDLSELFHQEEGAMYRITLSFKRTYASAPFYSSPGNGKRQDLHFLSDNRIDASKEEKWDRINAYYYIGDDIDWNNYQWRDRDNPYTETYYMENNKVSTNLLASNLGMIVKANEDGDYWILVNDILEAEPVRGATVTLYSLQMRKLASGKTDGEGRLQLKTTAKPFFAVASKGKQQTYLRVVEGENNSFSRFDVGGERLSKGINGFIYGERGVWRPGDTLFLTFLLNDRDHRIPDNHPVSIELFNPRGQFAYRKLSNASVNGFYTFVVPTQPDAPTGIWHAYVKVGQAVFHKSLRIETIKPNRLKIDFQLASSRIRAGNPIHATLRSSWLSGPAAAGLQADVEMTLAKNRSPFKGYEAYEFHNPLADFSSKAQQVYAGRLSGTGEAQLQIQPLVSDNMPGKLHAHFICRVAENGGDVSVVSKSYLLSPYDVYVGIRSNMQDTYRYIETGVEHPFDVVTLTADGKPTDAASLEYVVYKIDWSYWWENEEEALSSYVNNTNVKVVVSGRLTTCDGKAVIPFKVDYPEWGKYLIFVKDKKGGHATACLFNVEWPSWMGNPDTENPSAINMLPFSLDKTCYQSGDEVVVNIPRVNTGEAILTVENASQVLLMKRISLRSDGKTTCRFKVTDEMAPNAYVQVMVLQKHRNTLNHQPIRMYGAVPFAVVEKNSELHPQITAPAVVRPQSPFTVRVKEKEGKAMTYTLAVVDEGLLGITRFKTPDPWAKFHAKTALGIRTWDMYNYIVGAFAGKYAKMFSIGGDDNLELSPNKANRFKPVVRFMGPFTLKKGETKSHRITLPLYVGAVRVMVVAGQDGAYGNAEKEVAVRAPLMLLSSLPRTLSVNETIELPVNVFAMEPSVKEVKVTVTTTGKATVTGGATQTVRFAETGEKMCYFKLETGRLEGTEKIVITASGNGHTAKEEVELSVRNPNPMASTTRTWMLEPGDSVSCDYRFDRQAKENLLQLEVSKLPALYVEQQYQFLDHYTHACTEQLVSKALPLLYRPLFGNLTEAENTALESSIRRFISDLYVRQQPSGGFSYWEGDHQVSDWLTSYVGHFFVLAKEQGYEVQSAVFDKWLAYQQKAAQSWREEGKTSGRYTLVQSDLVQAYRLYTLALAGRAESGAMNRLKGSGQLSLQARWRLAAAYAVSGKQQVAAGLVDNVSRKVAAYSSSNNTFGSSLRDEAMILESMILMGRTKEAFLQARQLSQQLQGDEGYHTHASAYALLAYAQLYDKVSGQLSFDWRLNGQRQTPVRLSKATFSKRLATQPLSGRLKVTNKGDGLLYLSLYQRTRPLIDTVSAQSRTLTLEVCYTDMTGRRMEVSQLKQGTDFMVHIKVGNTHPTQKYNNIALSYILPSGWEVVSASPSGDDKPDGSNYQDVRDDRVLTYFDMPANGCKEVSLRLRASYCGRYQLPAVKCEAMYDPQVYARTAAGKTVVSR